MIASLRDQWRYVAVDRWYASQDHVGQADTNPEPYVRAASDAAVALVLRILMSTAEDGVNHDDALWYRRFKDLLPE